MIETTRSLSEHRIWLE